MVSNTHHQHTLGKKIFNYDKIFKSKLFLTVNQVERSTSTRGRIS